MYERRYSKFLTILLIVIIIAVIGLLGFLGYNFYNQHRIKKTGNEFVDAFTQEVSTGKPSETSNTTEGNTSNGSLTTNTTDGTSSSSSSSSSTSNKPKRKTYGGFEVLGTIEIPKTNANYPVLAKVTKKSLEKSVGVIYPFENAVLNTVGNTVIVGHNYRNGTFFSNNKKLSNGDKIKITDEYGTKITYNIYEIFETTDTDTSFYNRDTDGKREITLSTCTDDSVRRLIIKAIEE